MVYAEQLLDIVDSEIAANRLTLPTLPDVAIKIGELVRRDDVDAVIIAREIAKDAAVGTRLLRAANSAAMQRGGKKVDSLQNAVARLGFNLTRALVSRFAMEQMFTARSPELREIMQEIWTRSLEVAAMSQVLAIHRTRLNVDAAMFAGLIHLVGMLPIIKIVDERPSLSRDVTQLKRMLAEVHPRVAKLVLKSWNFPTELIDVPAQAFDFMREHDGPADLADVVSVAILQIYGNDDVPWISAERMSVPAFAKLGISPEVETLEVPEVQEAFEGRMELLAA